MTASSLHYDTPENVRIECRPAGLGTRFIAWLIDTIVVYLLLIFTGIAIIVLAAVFHETLDDVSEYFQFDDEKNPEQLGMYLLGLFMLAWGFSSLVYFGLSEWFLRGQTLGKRLCRLRTVKADGFSLDAASILLRNVMRVADQLPVLWIVPVVSRLGQRLGDMVAGTIVISEEINELARVREVLATRNASDAMFRFDHSRLSRLGPADIDAMERLLDGWGRLSPDKKTQLLSRIIPAICRKIQMEPPESIHGLRFLEELLAAEYRRQDRRLQ